MRRGGNGAPLASSREPAAAAAAALPASRVTPKPNVGISCGNGSGRASAAAAGQAIRAGGVDGCAIVHVLARQAESQFIHDCFANYRGPCIEETLHGRRSGSSGRVRCEILRAAIAARWGSRMRAREYAGWQSQARPLDALSAPGAQSSNIV